MKLDAKSTIEAGKAILGIELGSTRIKAVLIDQENKPIAQGSHTWENQLVDGLWTYNIEAIWSGLQDCYADLRANVKNLYGIEIETLAAIGVSAMMHGYMPFNKKEEILVPFRTWRNTNTGRAAAVLSELFVYNIPLRWSISHLYQAILDNEAHVNDIDFLTTLAGYVHWQITGEKVLGIGDASGMLPIDPTTHNYSAEMVAKFDKLIAPKEYSWKLEDILPKVLSAGENAGVLTPEGSKKLDASGHLKAGIPVCPPEGDAGTGMVATNAVKQRTGNVSAGTSSFSMIVLEKDLSKPYEMIDMVTTPDGSLVAMVHCNNCTSDLNAWVNLFKEYQELLGIPVDMDEIYSKLYNIALTGDTDCGGLLSYNYISGEPVTGFADGRPLFVRSANDKFNLANFMRTHLYASVGVLKLVQQLAKKKIDIPFIGPDGVKDEQFIKVAGKNAEGVYATGPTDVSKLPMNIQAHENHKKKYGTEPGAFYDNAYSATVALLEAIKAAGSTDSQKIMEALRTNMVDTPLGKIKFDAKGDAEGIGFSIYEVKDGKFVELK